MALRSTYTDIFVILLGFLLGVNCNVKKNVCGDGHIVQEKGIIRSPYYPLSYPNATNCTWTILSPPFSILTLVVKDFDVAEDQNCTTKPCCKQNGLTLPLGVNGLYREICGRDLTFKPIHLSQKETEIRFHTLGLNNQARGFLIAFFIETFHGGLCPPDKMSCSKNSNHCFTTSIERCDGIFHCPNGEDEAGCEAEDILIDKLDFKTSFRDKCIHQPLWCEGNYACDQDACLRNSVVSATIMGCLSCGLLLIIAMMCGLRFYSSNQNGRNYRIQIPAHIASRLSLTRYVSLPELIDDDFFHREPPPSYSMTIGESTLAGRGESIESSRRADRSREGRGRSRSRREGMEREPEGDVKPPTPPPPFQLPAAPSLPFYSLNNPELNRFQPIEECWQNQHAVNEESVAENGEPSES